MTVQIKAFAVDYMYCGYNSRLIYAVRRDVFKAGFRDDQRVIKTYADSTTGHDIIDAYGLDSKRMKDTGYTLPIQSVGIPPDHILNGMYMRKATNTERAIVPDRWGAVDFHPNFSLLEQWTPLKTFTPPIRYGISPSLAVSCMLHAWSLAVQWWLFRGDETEEGRAP